MVQFVVASHVRAENIFKLGSPGRLGSNANCVGVLLGSINVAASVICSSSRSGFSAMTAVLARSSIEANTESILS